MMTSDDIRENIAENLRRMLEDRAWNTAKLVERSGVPTNTVYRILRGENEPSLTHIAAICDVLGCSIDRVISRPPELSQIPA